MYLQTKKVIQLYIKLNWYIIYINKNNKNILENKISKQTVYNNIDDKFEFLNMRENIINNLAYNISSEILMSVTA